MAQSLADDLGAVLDATPGATWVRLRRLSSDNYAKSGGLEDGVRPGFVTILQHTRPVPHDRARIALAVADAVAETIQHPVENVHVIFSESAGGRVAFGGRLVE